MSKRADIANHEAASNTSRPPFARLGQASQHAVDARLNVRRKANPRDSARYEDSCQMLDRALIHVGLQCDVLRRAVRDQDLGAAERAGYALASAWCFAEGHAMRILSTKTISTARAQFARKALCPTSSVITACFGEALAETSRWSRLQPSLPLLGRLRVVLCQLSARVDVREHRASRPHRRGDGLVANPT